MNQQTAKTDPGENPEIEAVRTALDSLPEHYRLPLTLYYFGGLNQNETAQALGAPAATVANQLARGLDRLRKKLGRAGFAVTSAGLLALFATIPTYAATPEFKASLVESRRLSAARQNVSERLLKAKKALSSSFGIFHAVVIGVVAAGAAIFATMHYQPAKTVNIAPEEDVGLVAHWTFDEGRGTTVKNVIGGDTSAILVNEPEWVPGKFGGALSFNGVNNYVMVPSSPSLNSIKGQLTIAAWVFKNGKSDNYSSIIGRRTGELYDDLWTILYSEGADSAYYFGLWTDKGEAGVGGPSSVGDLGKWVHIASTYDGMSARFYRNGILAGTKEAHGMIPDETSPVMIGASDAGPTFGVAEFLNGAVDDVRIYNRALSESEIAALGR